jgi:uncharacterized protein with NRDE domain
VYGLSNAGLDTPWPKLQRLKSRLALEMAQAGQSAEAADHVLQCLLDALQDRHQPADEELPLTGVPLEWERWLGRVFIETPDARYGTRCSTVIVVEQTTAAGWRLHVMEQSWDAQGHAAGLIRHTLPGFSSH